MDEKVIVVCYDELWWSIGHKVFYDDRTHTYTYIHIYTYLYAHPHEHIWRSFSAISQGGRGNSGRRKSLRQAWQWHIGPVRGSTHIHELSNLWPTTKKKQKKTNRETGKRRIFTSDKWRMPPHCVSICISVEGMSRLTDAQGLDSYKN